MVQVRDGQAPAAGIGLDQAGRPVQEGHRVGAAGDGEDEGGIVGDRQAPGAGIDGAGEGVSRRSGSGGRIRTTGQGLMSPLLYH